MANGEGLMSGLNNLPIFEGQPDEAKRRALISAGLALLEPSPATNQTSLGAAFGNSVGAGLNSLDQDAALARAGEQQTFENLITSRQTGVQEAGVPIDQQRADASTTNAQTGAAAEVRATSEFTNQQPQRDAQALLDEAKAKWFDERSRNPGGAAGKKNSAEIEAELQGAIANNLKLSDPERYQTGTDPQGNPIWNEDLARQDAFVEFERITGTAANENLAVIISNEAKGGETIENVRSVLGQAPLPNSATADISVASTQADVDKLKKGSKFRWTDGQVYTKD